MLMQVFNTTKSNTMWTTESLWFEIAIVSTIYALGNILMGHFEERTPKIRRVGKFLLSLVVICCISVYFGRGIAMTVLSFFAIPLLYVHGYYLPKRKGINGWTGEPKSKYYAFRKWSMDIFSKDKLQ
jgi:hypothetical protein